MAILNAACIIDGEVVNVAVYDEETSVSWLAEAKKQFDKVLIVPHAGIGWKVTDEGLRGPKPDEITTWVWDDDNGWWDRPVPYPSDGLFYVWDEASQNWVVRD